jgi:hypothetical protein
MKTTRVIVILIAAVVLVIFDVGLWLTHDSYTNTSTPGKPANTVTSPTPQQNQSATVGPQPNSVTSPTPSNSASQRRQRYDEEGGD